MVAFKIVEKLALALPEAVANQHFSQPDIRVRGRIFVYTTPPMLIDTHCHLDLNRFDKDRDAVVERALAAGIERIVVPAIELGNCEAVLALTERYEAVYAAVGVHPNSTADWQDSWISSIRDFAAHDKVVAIGEIGLDYHWDRAPKAIQHEAFRAQLALADELELPVIVHNRESSDDVVRLLAESPLNGKERPGVLHSFSAAPEIAAAILEMGFYLGFTGPLTYKRADELRTIAATVPQERILVETDAPFLAPQKYRGKRNEPAYVAEVVDRMAALHLLSPEKMAAITTENALRLFQIPA